MSSRCSVKRNAPPKDISPGTICYHHDPKEGDSLVVVVNTEMSLGGTFNIIQEDDGAALKLITRLSDGVVFWCSSISLKPVEQEFMVEIKNIP